MIKTDKYNLGNGAVKVLFDALPVLPEPQISRRALAKKMHKQSWWVNMVIKMLPVNVPIYESDHKEIGRIV